MVGKTVCFENNKTIDLFLWNLIQLYQNKSNQK